MEFRTYTIESNPDKTVQRFSFLILLLLLGMVAAYLLDKQTLATVLFVADVVIIIVLAIIKKGKIQTTVLSKNVLSVSPQKISVAGKEYDFKRIMELVFTIDSFAGMDAQSPVAQGSSDGMDNYVKFSYEDDEKEEDEKISCRFFLRDREHALTLVKVFDEFYRLKIPFIEKDRRGYQTYLFRRLNEKELEEFKKKYGYK